MFLLSQRAKQLVGDGFYKFQPYLYGPYSPQLASDLDKLAKSGEIVANYTPGYRHAFVGLASLPEGFRRANEIKANTDSKAVDFVERTADWVSSQTFSSLLASIYKWYPEYATRSVFKG